MQELARDIFTAPLGTIFVLAGVVFLLIAVIGNISGKIETGTKARVLSAVLGSAFITIGLGMYWTSLPKSTDVPIPPNPPVKLPKRPEEDKPAPQLPSIP